MNIVAIIQARMGSTRLPGKAMLALNCTPVIQHVVRRTAHANSIDTTLVATTEKDRDNTIKRYACKEGAEVFRGDEEDVLGRMWRAANEYNADVIVRITADNPLLSPKTINSAVKKLKENDVQYVSNKINRSFPSGFDVEVFTFDSFTKIENKTIDPFHREHATPYYRQSQDFYTLNVKSKEVFDEESMWNRTELRLTLDTPADYELFSNIYSNVMYDGIIGVRDAIQYIDKNNLKRMNIE